MQGDALSTWAISCLLLSLRIAPVFTLAPPFSLVRLPVVFRMLLGVGLATALASANPDVARLADLSLGSLLTTAARELALGGVVALVFQVMFAALYVAGRTVDIQAGFGLAMLIDPTTRTQTPLVGTLFAYAAGAIFFAMNGQADLLRIFAASLEAIPLGGGNLILSVERLTAFMSVAFVMAFGAVGGIVLCLFLADVAIALLSRTTPQMNVLVLGFQVKTLILLLVLPVTLGMSAAILTRLTAVTLEAVPRLL